MNDSHLMLLEFFPCSTDIFKDAIIGRLLTKRRNIAKAVSKIGTPSTSTGMITATMVALLTGPKIDMVESINPKNNDPPSPMKIFAG